MAVQGDDVERHRGDVHGEDLGVGQQEAEGAAELPLPLQRVDQGEGEAQRVDQQVGCRQRAQIFDFIQGTVRSELNSSRKWDRIMNESTSDISDRRKYCPSPRRFTHQPSITTTWSDVDSDQVIANWIDLETKIFQTEHMQMSI